MLRRLNRKSRISSTEAPVYAPEPKYAVQPDEEKRRSTSSSQEITRQRSSGEIVQVEDETSMTLEEIKLKRKVSVSHSGKVHKKSSRNSVVDIFGGDKDQAQQWDDSEGSRQPRNSSDLEF